MRAALAYPPGGDGATSGRVAAWADIELRRAVGKRYDWPTEQYCERRDPDGES
jgi:hypothetical protein